MEDILHKIYLLRLSVLCLQRSIKVTFTNK